MKLKIIQCCRIAIPENLEYSRKAACLEGVYYPIKDTAVTQLISQHCPVPWLPKITLK